MVLDEIAQEEIKAYFTINMRVEGIKTRIRRLKESFYNQSMATQIESDGLQLVSCGFNPERHVIPYVDELSALEEAIREAGLRRRYLNDYLRSLKPTDRVYLVNRYSGAISNDKVIQSDIDLYDEIMEIDDAINFMRGDPPEIREDNEALESDFDDITNLLGV